MKKTHKRVLGLLGLGFVAATTAFAAALPNDPTAFATAQQLTDHLQVRVVGGEISATIDSPKDGSVLVSPSPEVVYSYSNAQTITITLEYTGLDGVTHTIVLVDHEDVAHATDTKTLPINLDDYGYGNYKLTISGEDAEGVLYEDGVEYSYIPVVADSTQTEDSSEVNIGLDYNTDPDSRVDTIEVIIYDENGQEVTRTTVEAPATSAAFDFNSLPSGNYTAVVTAYDENGNALYEPYSYDFYYTAPDTRRVVPVPNTGSVSQGTNISMTDYLITGLIIFGVVAIAGTVYMIKNDRKTRTGKTNRRK